MDRIFGWYSRAREVLIAIGLGLMVVLVFGNVALRYVFNSGIAISEEMSRWLFIWVTFLGAIVALRERAHLGTGFLLDHLPVAGQKLCLVLGHLLMLMTCWLVLQGSWEQAKINWDVSAPSSGFSMAIFYASGVVFAASALVILLHDLIGLFTGRLSAAQLARMRESEEEQR